MQTRFSAQQLTDPEIAASEPILRACVHCGFCTATCPTYVLLGDELDSPRGRIHLIRNMLEQGAPASEEVVTHIDRCLSCLSCMSTCPSGVHYQHLIDHARVHVERTFRRPWRDRLLRWLLASVLPHRARFRAALRLAHLTRPLHRLLPGRLRVIAAAVPARTAGRRMTGPVAVNRRPRRQGRNGDGNAGGGAGEGTAETVQPGAADPADPSVTGGRMRRRVALLEGCVQPVLAPEITAAAERLLVRCGADVVRVGGCCGALTHHLGRERETRRLGTSMIDQLHEVHRQGALAAVAVTASGCGTHAKDFGWQFRDSTKVQRATDISEKVQDITEVLLTLGLPSPVPRPALTVAYHSACSMQHGQQLHRPPRALLRAAGFTVVEIAEGHLCCGSAGTYNLLQPEIAAGLRDRKLVNILATRPDVVATGNIGCIAQLGPHAGIPVVHTVQLLDWATGGPTPPGLD